MCLHHRGPHGIYSSLVVFITRCWKWPDVFSRSPNQGLKLDLGFAVLSLACCWLKQMHCAAFNLAVQGNSLSPPQLPAAQAQGLESEASPNGNRKASNEFKCIAAKQDPSFLFLLFSRTLERLEFLPSSRWDRIDFRATLTSTTSACCTFSRHSGHSVGWRRKASEIPWLTGQKSWWHCSARGAHPVHGEKPHVRLQREDETQTLSDLYLHFR